MMQRPNQQKKSADALEQTPFVIQLIKNVEGKASCEDNSDLFTFPPKVQLNRLKRSSYVQEEPSGFRSKAK